MRILIAHNRYQERGGEDTVVENEVALLRAAGHEVEEFIESNDEIRSLSDKIRATLRIVNNPESVAKFQKTLGQLRPDIVHFHNVFPRLSLGAVASSLEQGIPSVLTLHNYRMICAGALLMRKGAVCERCVGASHLAAIRFGCYRGSKIGSSAIARLGWSFRRLYHSAPNLTLIALTEFAKSRFVADGYSPDRIVVKGNTTMDVGQGPAKRRPTIVYVGRLSKEKGVDTLVRAAEKLDVEIEIVGGGPEEVALRGLASPNVKFLGPLSHDDAVRRIKTASAVAMPSRWYEGFPMVLVEAFSAGTPVIASEIGSLTELIDNGTTGVLLPPNNVHAWRLAMERVVSDPSLARSMGMLARTVFEERYSPSINVKALEHIYMSVIGDGRKRAAFSA